MNKFKRVIVFFVAYALLCWAVSPAEACGYVSTKPVVVKAMGVK